MYRSNASRVKRLMTWTASALVAVGSGVLVANLTAPASVVRTASSTPIASGALVSSAALSSVGATSLSGAVRGVTVAAPGGTVSPSTVVAITSGSLTVRSRAGVVTTYAVTSSTTVLSGRSRISIASVRTGDAVFVIPSAVSPTTAGTIGVLPSSLGAEHESRTEGAGDGSTPGDY